MNCVSSFLPVVARKACVADVMAGSTSTSGNGVGGFTLLCRIAAVTTIVSKIMICTDKIHLCLMCSIMALWLLQDICIKNDCRRTKDDRNEAKASIFQSSMNEMISHGHYFYRINFRFINRWTEDPSLPDFSLDRHRLCPHHDALPSLRG